VIAISERPVKAHHVNEGRMGWQPMPRPFKGVEEEVD